MITTPLARKEELAYELFRAKRFNTGGYTMAQARIDAQVVIDSLLTLTPGTTVIEHPLVKWVADKFRVHWPESSLALVTLL